MNEILTILRITYNFLPLPPIPEKYEYIFMNITNNEYFNNYKYGTINIEHVIKYAWITTLKLKFH